MEVGGRQPQIGFRIKRALKGDALKGDVYQTGVSGTPVGAIRGSRSPGEHPQAGASVAGLDPPRLEVMICEVMRSHASQKMKGVQFLVDDQGEKTGVLIDLKKNAEIWEDHHDRAPAEARANEPRESLDSAKKRIQRRVTSGS